MSSSTTSAGDTSEVALCFLPGTTAVDSRLSSADRSKLTFLFLDKVSADSIGETEMLFALTLRDVGGEESGDESIDEFGLVGVGVDSGV